MKKSNKIISTLLIITMLVLPFSFMPKVNADTQTIKGIQIDTSISKDNDSNAKLIIGTTTIALYEGKMLYNQVSDGDSFSAYKVLDAFYNSTTNEISYQFTNAFQAFVSSLTTQQIRDITENNQAATFTVKDYLDLTSDDSNYENNNTPDNYKDYQKNRNIAYKSATINKLVSLYAVYINSVNNDNNANNNISSISMTENLNYQSAGTLIQPQDGQARYVASCTAQAGAYLILPDQVISKTNTNDDTFTRFKTVSTYGVLIANLVYKENNDVFSLAPIEIYIKKGFDNLYEMIVPYPLLEILQAMSDPSYPNAANILTAFSNDLNINKNTIVTLAAQNLNLEEIPTNTATSIQNNSTIINKLNKMTITLPAGVTIHKIYDPNTYQEATVENGNIIYNAGSPINTGTIDGSTITFETLDGLQVVQMELAVDTDEFTPGVAKNIQVESYYLKDAYRDISGMSQQEAEEAVLGKQTSYNTLTTYGIELTNIDNSQTPNTISGGEFRICKDASCNTVIMDNITLTNGTESVVGVSGEDTIYIVQTKAPSGYKKASPVSIDLSSITRDTSEDYSNGYYLIKVTNEKILPLPFTGGIGTIIYTSIGLLLVIWSISFIVKTKKKKENYIEEL